jgi:hypothetical protein
MEADGVQPNEATLTSVARLAAATRDPAMAFSVVRRMPQAGIPPRLRSYGPAFFAYCDAKDADGASQVEAHMDASAVVPAEPELAALLRVNADNARADELYRLLHRTRALVRQVCDTTAQVVRPGFFRMPRQRWEWTSGITARSRRVSCRVAVAGMGKVGLPRGNGALPGATWIRMARASGVGRGLSA